MNKRKHVKNTQRGSALLLTVIVLANSLFIVLAVTAVSIMERQITQKTKMATPAFQAAESGIDWAMRIIADANPGENLGEYFTVLGDNVDGKIDCDAGDIDCAVYLINGNNAIITELDSTKVSEVKAIRSVGRKEAFGEEGTVTRAIEVQAAPNCPEDMIALGDFCVSNSGPGGNFDWESALDSSNPNSCISQGLRLCSVAELMAACQYSENNSIFNGETVISSGLIDVGNALAVDQGCNVTSVDRTQGGNFSYTCCKNR